MKKQNRWGAIICGGAAVIVALLGAVYHMAGSSTRVIERQVLQHEREGRMRWPKPPGPQLYHQWSSGRVPLHIGTLAIPDLKWHHLAGPRGTGNAIAIRQALGATPSLLDVASLMAEDGRPSPEALGSLLATTIEWYETDVYEPGDRGLADTGGDWHPLSATASELLTQARRAALEGRANPEAPGRMVIWAAAAAFGANDAEAGRALVRVLVQGALDDPGLYSIRGTFTLPLPEPKSGSVTRGDAGSDVAALLLVLDAAGAPREVLAEVLRVLCEEAAPLERIVWMAEADSLRIQDEIGMKASGAGSYLAGRNTASDLASWITFHAFQPIHMMRTKALLDGWRAHDGGAITAAEASIVGSPRPLPSGMVGTWHDQPLAADAWQYAVDCAGPGRRAAPLEMARFMAAAMLFHRDTGAWPARTADVVPAYVAADKIDTASEWFVAAVPPILTYRRRPGDATLGAAAERFAAANKRLPRTFEELNSVALPGEDLTPFADRFFALPPRPIFCRIGPADPCSAAAAAQLFPELPITADPNRAEQVRAALAGGTPWKVVEAVGFNRVPPESLIRIVAGQLPQGRSGT